MPYCPTCKTERDEGKFCAHCGVGLLPEPPSEPLFSETRGDASVDRSMRQTVVVTPTGAAGQEAQPWGYCPIDGLYVRRDNTFRCRQCGRDHLCREHLDSELRVCEECAARMRRSAQQELEERVAPLRAEAEQQLRAGNLAQALLACGQALALAPDDAETIHLAEAGRAALHDLAAEAWKWQQASEEAPAQVARRESVERARRAEEERKRKEAEERAGLRDLTGAVKWFSQAKGYGFIKPDPLPDGTQLDDVFVHDRMIEKGHSGLLEGERVRFQIQHSPKGPEAMHVSRI